MKRHLKYANVVSTLALVFALGTGGAWAARQINGGLLKDRTISAKKVKRNALTGAEIRESKLGTVPRASNALKLNGQPASSYLTSAGTAANATNATNATNAANAANADKLGGIGPSGFVQGGGTHTSGRATGSAGADPNVVKTFTTPVGEFRLSCGTANADARYLNTGPGNADVFRFYAPPSSTGTAYDSVAQNDNVGYATTAVIGPTYVDIRAGKGDAAAILRVGERRQGTDCIFDWELVTSG